MTERPPRILIATTNRSKIREISPLLAGMPIDILTLAAFPDITPPPETGDTFAENARAKALFYASATGQMAVGEDSGLEIDALDRAPGVKSARFGGENATYPEKFELIYAALRAKGLLTSTVRYVCAVAVAADGRIIFETQGTVEGQIAGKPRGEGGFGYDPIFFYPPFGCTLAEVDASRKAAVSHRGAAFRTLRGFLEQRFAEMR
jgi:XTP/dITP diphosphohydrolase